MNWRPIDTNNQHVSLSWSICVKVVCIAWFHLKFDRLKECWQVLDVSGRKVFDSWMQPSHTLLSAVCSLKPGTRSPSWWPMMADGSYIFLELSSSSHHICDYRHSEAILGMQSLLFFFYNASPWLASFDTITNHCFKPIFIGSFFLQIMPKFFCWQLLFFPGLLVFLETQKNPSPLTMTGIFFRRPKMCVGIHIWSFLPKQSMKRLFVENL